MFFPILSLNYMNFIVDTGINFEFWRSPPSGAAPVNYRFGFERQAASRPLRRCSFPPPPGPGAVQKTASPASHRRTRFLQTDAGFQSKYYRAADHHHHHDHDHNHTHPSHRSSSSYVHHLSLFSVLTNARKSLNFKSLFKNDSVEKKKFRNG